MTEVSSPAKPLLNWRVHPAAQRPRAAAISIVFIIAFSTAATIGFGHWGWGVLSAGVLFISLNRFFLPSEFAIDETGITARFPLAQRRIEWKAVRRFEPAAHEVVLSPSLRRSRLNAGRELHIPLGTSKAAAIEIIRSRLPDVAVKPSPPQARMDAANEAPEPTTRT